jgi:hypothetical protein
MSTVKDVGLVACVSSLIAFSCFLIVVKNMPTSDSWVTITEVPIFKLYLDKTMYKVGDGISADYLVENNGDSPITFTPPELVEIEGGYIGPDGRHTVLNADGSTAWIGMKSAPRTWMPMNVTVPPHSIKVIQHIGFQTDKVGYFEIICQGVPKILMIYP